MKIEEQFIDVIYNNVSASKIKKGCMEIANNHAIGFSQWKDVKYWYSKDNKCYFKYGLKDAKFTIAELLEIYNQQNNLKQ